MTPEEFKKLPKAKQRVEIARDVIAQIQAKRYRPGFGIYVSIDDQKVNPADSVQNTFNKLKNCSVCALGSAILSITKYKNKLTYKDFEVYSNEFTPRANSLLASVFSPRQISMIETAFEGAEYFAPLAYEYSLDYETKTICKAFADNDNAEKTLIRIMNNIISNKGTFKP